MAQEHQEYIQTKVNPTLENLVTQVLLERPDNPVPFMIQWLANQTKTSAMLDSGEAEQLKNEIRTLQQEVGELESKLGPSGAAASDAPGQGGARDDDDEEEEDDDDDVDDMPPPPAAYLQGKQRASVSAEAYGAWNQVKSFTPPVHAKTADQKTRLTDVLTSCFLFSSLEKAELDIIINAMVETGLEADKRIIQEGEDGDVMYVIEKGIIECLKVLGGEEKVVKRCGPGDFFGELALLYNCPRAASVEAREASVLWQLDRETFNHIVRDASMKKRETYEDFLKSVPLFETLGSYERGAVADSLKKETVAAGSSVISQGEVGNKFYIVSEGSLTAKKKGADSMSKDVFSYKRGDYFGELALLNSEVRAATVVANTDCELLWLDAKTFKSLLGPVEEIMKRKASEYVP